MDATITSEPNIRPVFSIWSNQESDEEDNFPSDRHWNQRGRQVSQKSNTANGWRNSELYWPMSLESTDTRCSSQNSIKSVASTHSLSSASYRRSLSNNKDIVRKFSTPSYNTIDILSLHKDKLLVGSHKKLQLDVYSIYGAGDLIKSIHISTRIRDATWTTQGNILVSAEDRIQEYELLSGDILGERRLPCPRRFGRTPSLSESLCLAVGNAGVYRSVNNSILDFKFAFRSRNGGRCREVIKTASKLYWVIENCNDGKKMRLRKYRTILDDRKLDIDNIDTRQKDICPSVADEHCPREISLKYSSLAACKQAVFVSECENNAIHAFSHSGQYLGVAFAEEDDILEPRRMAVDAKHQLLYVGQYGAVNVYTIPISF
jgi:hypothetical protein